MLDEPKAAALAYNLSPEKIGSDKYIVVFNLGESSCTVTVLDHNLEHVNKMLSRNINTHALDIQL